MTTHPKAAAPRLRTGSPFVLPTGAACWQLPAQLQVPFTGHATTIAGYSRRTGSHDATFAVINPAPTVGADARGTAMKDRPPRGVPR